MGAERHRLYSYLLLRITLMRWKIGVGLHGQKMILFRGFWNKAEFLKPMKIPNNDKANAYKTP
jgi:hypothetical protein